MASELLVFASCLMLTFAQLQLQQHQFQSLIPNVQPFQFTSMPNSELIMTHTANTILNQDRTIPISPGMLAGAPVLVSEATQNILDQEARIVGYNVPNQPIPQQQQIFVQSPQQQQQVFVQSPQQQQQIFVQSPQLIPIFQTGYSANGAGGQATLLPQAQPQTISFPVINIAQQPHQQPVNIVPVQAIASLKSVIDKSKKEESIAKSKFNSYSSYKQLRTRTEYKRPTPTVVSYIPRPSPPVYHDIPDDHPLPAPLVHKKEPSKTRNRFQEPPQNSDAWTPVPKSREIRGRDSDVEYMRPPLPQRDRQRSPSPQPSSRHENFAPAKYNSRDSHPSNKRELPSSGRDVQVEVGKAHQSDSSSQSSESYYNQDYTGTQQNYNEQPSHSYSAPNHGGYSSNSDSIVHKHIFVHAAPQAYNEGPRVKLIKSAAPPEKHVQVIFVKSPEPPPQEQTIVQLPENPQMKTVVYVLAKKQEGGNDVKIIGPPPTKPSAPEIYFIRYGQRYGDKNSNQGYPVANLQSLYDNYGSYSQPAATPYESGRPLRSKRNHDGLAMYAPLMSYSTSGQINEITQDEADFRRTNVDAYF
ncbi:unnamed protein product [Orchesella dallaii]|uniref:DUF243 domain-containing protein n=1 Tax=Orchesella dallaii TaxID=48710 RepID=A0ABP1RDC4_9HEXA